MAKLENENAELRKSLDAVVSARTDEKQMNGTVIKYSMFAAEPEYTKTISNVVSRF